MDQMFEIEINAAQARFQAENPFLKVWFDLLGEVYDLQPIEFTDLGGEG